MTMFERAARAIAFPIIILLTCIGAATAAENNLTFQGIAIQGYDPVAYFTDNKAVPGNPEITASYDGATYQFASGENKAAFEANPGKYAPQYGGYCAYGASQGYNASIEPEQFTIADGKLYLNYNADVRKRWNQDRGSYISKADAYWASQ
jgi:YHS domain-containing protein